MVYTSLPPLPTKGPSMMACISTRRPSWFPLWLLPTLSSDFQNKHVRYTVYRIEL
jgi:hypothetical protein